MGDRQGEFLASVDSYYPIGEDTGEAGMGMGADFDDADYANEYDADEEEGRREVVPVSSTHLLVEGRINLGSLCAYACCLSMAQGSNAECTNKYLSSHNCEE